MAEKTKGGKLKAIAGSTAKWGFRGLGALSVYDAYTNPQVLPGESVSAARKAELAEIGGAWVGGEVGAKVIPKVVKAARPVVSKAAGKVLPKAISGAAARLAGTVAKVGAGRLALAGAGRLAGLAFGPVGLAVGIGVPIAYGIYKNATKDDAPSQPARSQAEKNASAGFAGVNLLPGGE